MDDAEEVIVLKTRRDVILAVNIVLSAVYLGGRSNTARNHRASAGPARRRNLG